ncbi:hypothetical protein [Streptomyces sp. NPDC004589]|uniref:hypothetical protein n=1 Tax=Streptomyces sp. NPDC004589 TaxID=3154553 RepID=UPI0033A024E1
MTVQEAFEALLVDNRRFVAGSTEHPNQDAAPPQRDAPVQYPIGAGSMTFDFPLPEDGVTCEGGPRGTTRAY